MKTDLPTFAARLKYAREKAGFETQAALAKAADVKQSAIGNYESGTRTRPRNILQIASALGVSAVWLEFGTGPMKVEHPQLLRADVAELAHVVQERLDEYQVTKLLEMVKSLDGVSKEQTGAPKK